MGITKSTPAETYPSSNAALYYFEKVDNFDNQYYVYCYNGDDKQYVYNGGNKKPLLRSTTIAPKDFDLITVLGIGICRAE